jgi:2-isopropylmalate synthase
MMQPIKIFDTTLRDGEQAPGFSMSPGQKLRMARTLALLNVDVIEAGFAAASPGDFDSVQRIAGEVQGPAICSLARCNESDIQAAARALDGAPRRRLHVFIATSPIHRAHKLKLDPTEVIARAAAGVEAARAWCDDVEFSAEDASRTEPAYLAEVLSAVIQAGATTVNIPDTVGYATPEDMTTLIRYLDEHVAGLDQVCLSVHCHDDLGMAVANSLASVQAGARQVECTINGIGERAGNAALEEIVMALKTRADRFGCTTGIDSRRLTMASRQLAAMTGQPVPRNKAIIGENAFAHEAGIHQHGMLAHRETYEIMRAEDVGQAAARLVLGKHSGRHAIAERAQSMGYELEAGALGTVFDRFKSLADRKRHVYDADIEAMILGHSDGEHGPWRILALRVESGIGHDGAPAAVLSMANTDGRDGPLDATCKAMQRATGIEFTLDSLSLRSVSQGEDAQGEAQLLATWQGETLAGHGVSTDIVVAAAQGLLDIVNRIARRADAVAPELERVAGAA